MLSWRAGSLLKLLEGPHIAHYPQLNVPFSGACRLEPVLGDQRCEIWQPDVALHAVPGDEVGTNSRRCTQSASDQPRILTETRERGRVPPEPARPRTSWQALDVSSDAAFQTPTYALALLHRQPWRRAPQSEPHHPPRCGFAPGPSLGVADGFAFFDDPSPADPDRRQRS